MSPNGDFEFREKKIGSGTFLLVLGMFGLGAIGLAFDARGKDVIIWAGALLMGLVGCIVIVRNWTDNGVKLALTGDGIHDHRSGNRVAWSDICGVRVVVTTGTAGGSAIMHVEVRGRNSTREVPFDVGHLDRRYDRIAAMVLQRARVQA